jgi:NAD-dependent dihydropyrimidine dehydrogenase PreA subunit
MLPTITVDEKKCPYPLNCRKCLLICPTHVLGLGTRVGPRKFKEIDKDQFLVAGVRFEKCSGCMDCVKVCPQNAIQVTF